MIHVPLSLEDIRRLQFQLRARHRMIRADDAWIEDMHARLAIWERQAVPDTPHPTGTSVGRFLGFEVVSDPGVPPGTMPQSPPEEQD